ncbi:MAG: class I SAM-dependent methyltransferase [bacterium]
MKVFDYDKFAEADYERDFWTSKEYEDRVERMALERLLPKSGDSIIDIGGGYGRLTAMYVDRFKSATVFYYAKSLLDKAKDKWGARDNVKFVQGDLYKMPFEGNSFDCALMVRVLHHVENVPDALREIKRVLKPGGVFVMEYANKRNLLEIMRLILGARNLDPFSKAPSARSELYYNFHPAYIDEILDEIGFTKDVELSVSNFRHEVLKKIFGSAFLAKVESILQQPLGPLKLSPSVFVLAKA